MRTMRLIAATLAIALGASAHAPAQIALSTAVDLALHNSQKVKAAQADLDEAHAKLGQAKDTFIPQVSTTGGVGKSTGAPISVPVVFSISAESLVFSFSQADYIRSAKAGVDATDHALQEARLEVAEDVTNTYVGLDNALQRHAVLLEEQDIANHLVDVTGQRFNAGVDPHIELSKAKRTAALIDWQVHQIDSEISEHATHLARLTGVAAGGLTTDHASIPELSVPNETTQANEVNAESQGVQAAFAVAKSKQLIASGDRHYLLRPQIALQANYSRVDTGLSSYLAYYPRFGGTPDNPNSQNALGFGLSVTVPLLDMTHRSKARASAAEAAHALAEANMQRDLFLENLPKLRNSTLTLQAQAEYARWDQEVAKDQLEALRVQLQASAGDVTGPQATPKDELNAHLQERQKQYDMLNAELQLHQIEVNLLRQQGGLGDWIHQSMSAPGQTPSLPVVAPPTTTPGSTPAPAGTIPGSSPGGLPTPPQPTAPPHN